MKIESLDELKKFMLDHCFNMTLYGIGISPTHDGFGIEKWGELFAWYYIEKGNRDVLKYFQTESEAAKFAFDQIINDKFAKSHFLIYSDDLLLIKNLVIDLNNRNVEFWSDEVPSFGRNKLTRIFIVGCDFYKIDDLKRKYSII
ncbi:hypothetical protein [Flavobacterium sp. ASV13]|uniref:hypothetical protein n=1 Tax=Flavobacterium sp. ASV13 TaxID=1506583 RepID=UPI00054F3D9C|nr:hypothetical protein [Flavobacterium sp. ASV13]